MRAILLFFSLVASFLKASTLDLGCEASETAIEFSSSAELVEHLKSLSLAEDRNELLNFLRAKYFDFSPHLRTLCSSFKDREEILLLIKELSSEFPVLAADCLCLAAKNHFDLPLDIANPLQSTHFRVRNWSIESIHHMLKQTKANEANNWNIRWDQAFKGILGIQLDEYLNVHEWNAYPARLWSTISFSSIGKANPQIQGRIYEIAYSSDSIESAELIARLLLIGFFYRRTGVVGTHELLSQVEETYADSLIKNLCLCIRVGGQVGPCRSFAFIEKLIDALKQEFLGNFAPFVNLFFHVAGWIVVESDWRWILRKFGEVLYDATRSNWPTLTETCTILNTRPSALLLSEFISARPKYLIALAKECPQLIPKHLVPLQARIETFFKNNRVVSSEFGTFSLRLTSNSLSNLLRICNQLEALYSLHRRKTLQLRVDCHVPKSQNQICRFSRLILAFFDQFLMQSDWFSHANNVLIPSAHCPPQILFTFGFLLGAAVIFQQPLPFKLSQEYF